MSENKEILENEEQKTEKSAKITPDSEQDRIRVVESIELSKKIAAILDAKKALDVKILNVHEKTIITDCFVFGTGTSTTQVNSLADEIEFRLTQEGIKPLRIEGAGSGTWVLIDYGFVIVHIFGVQSKEFYKLEKLWSEGVEVPFEKLPTE